MNTTKALFFSILTILAYFFVLVIDITIVCILLSVFVTTDNSWFRVTITLMLIYYAGKVIAVIFKTIRRMA